MYIRPKRARCNQGAKKSPCIMCVQYIGGCSVHQGGPVHRGDSMSTLGGYHEYIGGCSVHQRDTMSTSGVFSTLEGYHEYIGGIS